MRQRSEGSPCSFIKDKFCRFLNICKTSVQNMIAEEIRYKLCKNSSQEELNMSNQNQNQNQQKQNQNQSEQQKQNQNQSEQNKR